MKKFIGFIVVVIVIAFAALMVFTKPSGAIEGIKNTQGDYMMATKVTENGSWEVKCYKKVIGDRYVETSMDEFVSSLPMVDAIDAALEEVAKTWDDVVVAKW